jgi:hypothetical protein
MKTEYDFSKGERGRFYRPGAVLSPPLHLDSDVLKALSEAAQLTGESVNDIANRLLKQTLSPTGA